MNWEIARQIINAVEEIVTTDQIKNCNMELEKQQIKIQLQTVDAACKVIDGMNSKDILDQKVKAFYD